MRMPIGPEFNPSTIVGELNRPEVRLDYFVKLSLTPMLQIVVYLWRFDRLCVCVGCEEDWGHY